jgi:transcriptional regulator with XRE-family HTH domain
VSADLDGLAAVGRCVRRRRQAAGLSIAQLARRAGIGSSTLSGLERGRRNPSLAVVQRLARVLGAMPGELLDGEGDR